MNKGFGAFQLGLKMRSATLNSDLAQPLVYKMGRYLSIRAVRVRPLHSSSGPGRADAQRGSHFFVFLFSQTLKTSHSGSAVSFQVHFLAVCAHSNLPFSNKRLWFKLHPAPAPG